MTRKSCIVTRTPPGLIQATLSGKDVEAIRDCTHKGWALGGGRFREQVEARNSSLAPFFLSEFEPGPFFPFFFRDRKSENFRINRV